MKNSTKKKFAVLLAAVMAVGVAVMPVSASPPTSTGDITFTAPTDPLKITSVPAFKFGTHPISVSDETYIINGTLTGTQPAAGDASLTGVINVQDARGLGPAAGGWNVTVDLSGFTSSATPSLSGSVLALDDGTVTYKSGGTSTAAVTASTISLTAGGAGAKYVTASVGAGGSWDVNVKDASLAVKASVMATGSHSATLTWTLNNTP